MMCFRLAEAMLPVSLRVCLFMLLFLFLKQTTGKKY